MENNLVDHWWDSIFEMKTLIGERKYPMLEKLIKSVLLPLHHVNSAVERSLSDNNNTVQTERNNMLEETIVSLKMKEHAQSKGGAENVVISESILNHINDAKCKDNGRLRKEKVAMEDARRLQKQKEEHQKKKIPKDTIRSDRILAEKESYVERGRKIEWRFWGDPENPHRCQCMFAESYGRKWLSRNIGGNWNDCNISEKTSEANKMGEGLLKSQADLGKKEEKYNWQSIFRNNEKNWYSLFF